MAAKPEVERVRALLAARPDDHTLTIREARGSLDVRLAARGYALSVRFELPPDYPFERATAHVRASSFHARYAAALREALAALEYDLAKPGSTHDYCCETGAQMFSC